MSEMVANRRFQLHEKHADLGAVFGHFGDWEVPLYYSSILQEHRAVRENVGVFDISHMGEIFVSGQDADAFLQEILCRDISRWEIGKACYLPLLNESAGIVDDVIVYQLNNDAFLFIVNAANVEKDFDWIQNLVGKAQASGQDVRAENKTEDYALLAVQGPKSESLLAEMYGDDIQALSYYSFTEKNEVLIARTGYTGEDGFELMIPKEKTIEVWELLWEKGAAFELAPIGFGARDTLRLEAGMLLYGHDMNDGISPLECGITWAVDADKDAFFGKDSYVALKEQGVSKKLIGFELQGRGIAREGIKIFNDGEEVGVVTSGSMSPTLNKALGLAYVNKEHAVVGNSLEAEIRSNRVPLLIVKKPFYKRNKS